MKTHRTIMAMGTIHHHPKPAQKVSYPVICITSLLLFYRIANEHVSLIHLKTAMLLENGSEFFSCPMYPYFYV
jgi:hypothetical protein